MGRESSATRRGSTDTRPGESGRTARGVAVAAVALVIAAACGDGAPEAQDGASSGRPAAVADVGEGSSASLPDERLAVPLPDVDVSTPSGNSMPLRERPGEVTVINFWATWCVPCLEEIPDLVALQDSIEDSGGRVLGIAVDSGSPDDVRMFAREHEMDYDLAMAGYRWAQQHFDVFGLPVTLVVDRDDTIRHRLVGPHGLEEFLAAAGPYLERAAVGGTGSRNAAESGS